MALGDIMDLMGYCQLCDTELWGDGKIYQDILGKDPGIIVCRDCYDFLEVNNKVNGRLIIKICRGCGKLKKVEFKKYKKKGRPQGSGNVIKIIDNPIEGYNNEM